MATADVLLILTTVFVPTSLVLHLIGRRPGVPRWSGPSRWRPPWRAGELYRRNFVLPLYLSCGLGFGSFALLAWMRILD